MLSKVNCKQVNKLSNISTNVRSKTQTLEWFTIPVIEHNSLKVGVSPLYWFIMPFPAAWGTGMVKVIGLWNFRLLGSTVTIGLTATLFPKSLAVNSGGMGWAYWKKEHRKNKYKK